MIASEFSPGDHLRVGRGLYGHHGVYVGDGHVVQFGGWIGDKRHTRVEEVPLSGFLRGGRAEVVDHSNLTWLGLWKLPPPLPPDRIVARARCLARERSEGAYNLVGRNCETVALWCVCGMGESLQRQRFQAGNAALSAIVTLYYSYLSGRGKMTRGRRRWMMAFVAVRVVLLVMYYRHNKRFYRDARPCAHL
jgi:hypothetical protein